MKLLLATLLLIAGCTPLPAAERNLTITKIIDPDRAQQITNALNQNFIDLWESKRNVTGADMTAPRYFIVDLLDPEKAELNAYAINQNFEDLWREKLEVNQASVKNRPGYSVVDLLDEASEEDNVQAINQNFEDAWRDLVDR